MITKNSIIWWVVGALVCALIVGTVIYGTQRSADGTQGGASMSDAVLTVEEKSDVLDTLNSDANSMATTSEAEAEGQEALGTVVETSAASEQSESEKLDVLKALQQ